MSRVITQLELDQAIRDRKLAIRDAGIAVEKAKQLEMRVESLEEVCKTALEERDKYKRKWQEVLAVMEDAREMIGNG